MRICHITSAHLSDDVRIFHKQCVSLAKNPDYEVFLLAAKGEDKIVKSVRIKTLGAQNSAGRLYRMFKIVNELYWKALEIDADVYQIHDPELLRIALKLKKKGKIVVYDAHEDLPRQILAKHWIPKFLRKTLSFCFERYENFIAAKLSAIITATPFIGERFIKINPNTVNINNFPILAETPESSIPTQKEHYICYAGGISKVRGVSYLLDSLHYLPGIKLKLAGKYSPEAYREELMSKSTWSQVEELGYLGRQEVNNLIKNSLAGIVTLLPTPNYLDSLPIKMFEYMYAGVPVVASDFPLWKSIVEGNQCGICVDPRNAKAIAEACIYLQQNPEQAKQFGNNGKEAVLKKFNWSLEEQKLFDLYRQLFSRSIKFNN